MSFFEQIENWDQKLFLFLNGLHNSTLDWWMWNISENQPFWIPVYLIFLYFLYKKFGLKGMLFAILGTVLVITFSDLISYRGFKLHVQRYRPTHNLEIRHLVHTLNDYKGGQYSFVSSHAANFFGIATFLGLVLREHVKFFLPFCLVWAAIIAYSRIYLGVHYPLDIICGGLIGIIVAFGMYTFYWKKLIVPKL